MVLRMCKVLAILQSRSQSPRVTLVQRNKSNTDSGNEIDHTAELVRLCLSAYIGVECFLHILLIIIIIIIIIIITLNNLYSARTFFSMRTN